MMFRLYGWEWNFARDFLFLSFWNLNHLESLRLTSHRLSKLFSKPSTERNFYEVCSSRWSTDKSISIRVYSESRFSTDFASFEESVVFMSSWISLDSDNTCFFCVSDTEFTFWVGKTLHSFVTSCLFSNLSFLCRDPAFVGSSHSKYEV